MKPTANGLAGAMTSSQHAYEVRPRKDKHGVDLISDALPFGRLWYEDTSAAVDYAKHRSRSHDAVIRVYDAAGNVIETQGHIGDVKVCHRRFLHTLICAKATRAFCEILGLHARRGESLSVCIHQL